MDNEAPRLITDRSKTLSDDSQDDDVVDAEKNKDGLGSKQDDSIEVSLFCSQTNKENRDTNNSSVKDYEHQSSSPSFDIANAHTKQLKSERDPPPGDIGDIGHLSSILASPTPSMEAELHDQNWSPLLQQEQQQTPQNLHQIYRRSPTITPTKLPTKQHQQNTTNQEEPGLLTFFSHSFDTLSDSDTCIQDMHREEEAGALDSGEMPHHYERHPPSTGRTRVDTHERCPTSANSTGIDISLPTLGHTKACDSSTDDISPIKLQPYEYTNHMEATADRQGHRRMYSLTQPMPQVESRDLYKTRTPYHRSSQNRNDETSTTGRAYERSPGIGTPSSYNRPDLKNRKPQQHEYQYVDRNLPNPIFVLKSNKRAFEGFVFLLSCLRGAESCPLRMSPYSHINVHKGNASYKRSESDNAIATRRVEAAVCFFGGSVTPRAPTSRSIFRHTDSSGREVHQMRSLRQKQLYDQRFDRRYFQTGSHISWDVEEHPPVHIEPTSTSFRPVLQQSPARAVSSSTTSKEAKDKKSRKTSISSTPARPTSTKDSEEQGHVTHSKERESEWLADSSGTGTTSPTNSVIAFSSGTEPPKMKYRCKLCGQPKQNHNCPYRRSLQRSIGVMVYPAVNSFSSHEPGKLAPPLNQMNNFVSHDSSGQTELSSLSSTSDTHQQNLYQQQEQAERCHEGGSGAKSGASGEPVHNSPTSSLQSSPECTPSHRPCSNAAGEVVAHRPGSSPEELPLHASSNVNRKKFNHPKHTHNSPSPDTTVPDVTNHNSSLPYHTNSHIRKNCVPLRPEQFRSVTSSLPTDLAAYQYPTVPLPYAQKKRLTDTLFSLTQRIPQCTENCAAMLRQAREKGMWDQGVAELMTQVVVALYCKAGDCQLIGLQKYLLSLGISC